MSEPVIKDCGCGKDHMTMPTDIDYDGQAYDLVCAEHKRHEPCRPCLKREGFIWPHERNK